jgi:Transposase zinc-binding domain
MVAPTYQPRDPSGTVLYQVVAEHLETFLAGIEADPTTKGLPAYVRDEFQAYLKCGILAHGFLRLGCDACPHQMLLAFSCKKRGFCPSCAGRRMAETAAHLVEQVIPWVPTRQSRVHQVRYAGCLAAHSKLRGVITPTPRQQGIETETRPVSSRWRGPACSSTCLSSTWSGVRAVSRAACGSSRPSPADPSSVVS